MGQPEQEVVVDMVTYLEETLAQMDAWMATWRTEREQLAMRLAAMRAASDPAVGEAAADYRRRLAENRPYETAEDAETLLAEAHRRFNA